MTLVSTEYMTSFEQIDVIGYSWIHLILYLTVLFLGTWLRFVICLLLFRFRIYLNLATHIFLKRNFISNQKKYRKYFILNKWTRFFWNIFCASFLTRLLQLDCCTWLVFLCIQIRMKRILIKMFFENQYIQTRFCC